MFEQPQLELLKAEQDGGSMDAISTASAGSVAARHHLDATQDSSREARLQSLVRAWWRDERPAWTEESWWDTTLHDGVRRILWLGAGPLLAMALAQLGPGDACPVPHAGEGAPGWPTPGHSPGWPCACQVVTAAAWEACAAWVAAGSAGALVRAAGSEAVEFDVGGGLRPIQDPAREELAHALRTSIPAMGNRISAARALMSHPRLVLLVESAAISAWAARLVLEHLTDLAPHEAQQVIEEIETRILRRLSSGRRPYHSAEVNRVARAARLRVCPETAHEARVRAFATRRVILHPGGDGMATLIAELPEVDAHRIHRRLTAIAAGLQADATEATAESRTRDQLRADILTDLLLGAQHQQTEAEGSASHTSPSQPTGPDPIGGAPGEARGGTTEDLGDRAPRAGAVETTGDPPGCTGGSTEVSRPEIQVVVTLETLLSLGDDPAEIPGVGPVAADVARVLAADGRWQAWIVDATGAVAATGTRGYVPSTGLARLVRAREPHCRFPGCRRPSARCDLDHAVPWPAGPTDPSNLGPLCRRHHNLKTHAPWVLHPSVDAAGSDEASAGWRWRTPAGFTITDSPEPPLTDAPLLQRGRIPQREPVARGPSTPGVAAQDGQC